MRRSSPFPRTGHFDFTARAKLRGAQTKAEGPKGERGLSMIGKMPAMPRDSQFRIILFMYRITVALSTIFNRLGYLLDNADHRALFFTCEEIGGADLRP